MSDTVTLVMKCIKIIKISITLTNVLMALFKESEK